jgi:hypothetical protein
MEAIATPDNLEAFLGLVLDAAAKGQWPLVVALLLTAVVFVARVLLSKKYPFFATGTGALVLNVLASAATGLATAFMGAPASWAVVWTVLMSVISSYGWTLVKSLGPLLLKVPFIAAMIPTKAETVTLVPAPAVKAPTSDQIVNGK